MLANLACKLVSQKEHERWTKLKQHLIDALLEELWDGESLRIKNAVTGETRRSTPLIRLMPLVAAKYLPSDIVDKMTTDVSKHLTH